MIDAADRDLYLAELRLDRQRFSALADADLTPSVAACPGWDVRDLLVHLGRIHRWAATRMLLEPGSEDASFPPRPADTTDLVEWLSDGLDQLIDLLSSTDLEMPCVTFVGERPRWWWLRRQAIETAVHRWDAQSALGLAADDLTGAFAAHAVSEWCELSAERRFRPEPDLAGSIHLHATDGDGDGEWLVSVDPEGFTWRTGHEKGDVALRAGRSDLILMLSNRVPASRGEIFGDSTLLDRLLVAAAS